MIVPGWAIIVMNSRRRADEGCRHPQSGAGGHLAVGHVGRRLWSAFGMDGWTARCIRKAPSCTTPTRQATMSTIRRRRRSWRRKPAITASRFRIFTTQQYDYMYKIAQVFEANLTEAGLQGRSAGDGLGDAAVAAQRCQHLGSLRHLQPGVSGPDAVQPVQRQLRGLVADADRSRRPYRPSPRRRTMPRGWRPGRRCRRCSTARCRASWSAIMRCCTASATS